MEAQLLLLILIFGLSTTNALNDTLSGGGRKLLQTGVKGMDVSSHQGNVNWATAYANGARFAYVKATEGTSYTNPYFAQQYKGSHNVGMIRGAYHFARPDKSSGVAQAKYFLRKGGRWSGEGKTLPGALDIEYNPSCGTSCTPAQKCYNFSKSKMAAWIRGFVNHYKQSTGVYPVIYTSADWYKSCVGNLGDLSDKCPLWIPCYCNKVTSYPYNWKVYTFWQYADHGVFPGDQNVFNGPYSRLQALARGGG